MHQRGGSRTDQDGPGRRLLGEPGGVLRYVSHSGVGQALRLAQTAEQDLPRMQPHAHGARLPQR